MTSTGKIVVFVVASSAVLIVLWYLVRNSKLGPFAAVRAMLDADVAMPITPPAPGALYEKPYPRRLSWNIAALILGPIWYLAVGLWAHASIMLSLVGLSGGVLAPVVWLYCGLKANEDLLEFRVARDSVY
jgi:hypothetical protein